MDATIECWYCGKSTMVPVGDYYRCTECGATWNEQPSMGGSYWDTEHAMGEMTPDKISRPVRRRRSTIKR